MEITRKINNNVALGVDSNGREIVVCGKGIGFPKMPYTLTDMSQVQRTYYDISAHNVEMFNEIPEDILAVATDIVDLARVTLNSELNPNLPITLADHLKFANERIKNNMEIYAPLSFDVESMYAKEYAIGKRALTLMKKKTGISLPASEATSIALHLINAEDRTSDMHLTLMMTKIIQDVIGIIESELAITFKKDSFNYSRFITHLRHLIQRQVRDQQIFSDNSELYSTVRLQYPKVAACVDKIDAYFEKEYHWKYSDEEKLYLIMLINGVCAEN